MSYQKPEIITADMIGDRKVRTVKMRPLCEIRTDEFYASDIYFACDTGEIIGHNDFLQQQLEGDYLQVTICDGDGGGKTIDVHRLIASAFCPKTKERNDVHHVNGDKEDNRSINLMWVTKGEHSVLHSLMKKQPKEYKEMVKRIKKDNRLNGKVLWVDGG